MEPEIALLCRDEESAAHGRAALKRLRLDLAECGYLPRTESSLPDDQLCATVAEWQRRFTQWIEDPIANQTYLARPLFDLHPAFGAGRLWRQVWDTITTATARNPSFLKLLANDCLSALPPLTFFENAVLDESGEKSESFALEQRALLPLVEVGRVLGFEKLNLVGCSTLERLELARSGMPAHDSIFRDAADTLKVLLYLQARTGLRLDCSGAEILPAQLSRLDRQALKSAFRTIHKLLEFTTHHFWEQ